MAATTKPKLLIVEGTDDRHVVSHLLERHGFPPNFEISDKGGYDPLKASISVEIKAPERVALGIVADANNDIAGRWQSISDGLKEAGCDVPETLSHSGSVFAGPRGNPRRRMAYARQPR